MKIILADKTELNPYIVIGSVKYFQGGNRDCLSFVFPVEVGIETLDKAFTESACERIAIYDDANSGEYIHTGYVIRMELAKRPVEVVPPTDETEAVYEERIIVTMAQRTYLENQIAAVNSEMGALLSGEEV